MLNYDNNGTCDMAEGSEKSVIGEMKEQEDLSETCSTMTVGQ
jgi:hypothetical protein